MPTTTDDETRYDLFLSYSRKDELFAAELEKRLETHVPPTGLDLPLRSLRVFRDRNDFTGNDYERSLDRHLTACSKMLVICSPHARASRYVDDEVRKFSALRGAEKIVCVLLDGLPNHEAKADQETAKAFPDGLCEALGTPLAADYRSFDPSRHRVDRANFAGAWYTTLANIYDRSRDEIEQREKGRLARQRLFTTTGWATLLLALSATIGWQVWIRSDLYQVRTSVAEGSRLYPSAEASTELWPAALAAAGKTDEAIESVVALSDHYNQRDALLTVATLLQVRGLSAGSRRATLKAYEYSKNDPSGKLVEALLRAGAHAEAKALLTIGLVAWERDSDSEHGLRGRGGYFPPMSVFLQLDQLPELVKAAKRRPPAETSWALYHIAAELAEIGRVSDAAAVAKDAVAAGRLLGNSFYTASDVVGLASLCFRIGLPGEAVEAVAMLNELTGDAEQSLLRLIESMVSGGEFDAAIEIARAPFEGAGSTMALASAGRALARARASADAEALLREAESVRRPVNAEVVLVLCDGYAALGKFDEAARLAVEAAASIRRVSDNDTPVGGVIYAAAALRVAGLRSEAEHLLGETIGFDRGGLNDPLNGVRDDSRAAYADELARRGLGGWALTLCRTSQCFVRITALLVETADQVRAVREALRAESDYPWALSAPGIEGGVISTAAALRERGLGQAANHALHDWLGQTSDAGTLLDIAEAFMSLQDRTSAIGCLERATTAAGEITEQGSRAAMLARVASLLARTGVKEEAMAVASDAIATPAPERDDAEFAHWAELTKVLADSGLTAHAIEAGRFGYAACLKNADDLGRSAECASIASLLASVGQYQLALQAARAASLSRHRLFSYSEILAAYAIQRYPALGEPWNALITRLNDTSGI